MELFVFCSTVSEYYKLRYDETVGFYYLSAPSYSSPQPFSESSVLSVFRLNQTDTNYVTENILSILKASPFNIKTKPVFTVCTLEDL